MEVVCASPACVLASGRRAAGEVPFALRPTDFRTERHAELRLRVGAWTRISLRLYRGARTRTIPLCRRRPMMSLTRSLESEKGQTGPVQSTGELCTEYLTATKLSMQIAENKDVIGLRCRSHRTPSPSRCAADPTAKADVTDFANSARTANSRPSRYSAARPTAFSNREIVGC